MGLTNALLTGLSGLNANAEAISVIGNNISNANTTGFKSSRADFETQISELLGSGSAPNGTSGGTNPAQIGLGVHNSTVARDFNTGSISPTGRNTDLAIQGNGFFTIAYTNKTNYTRAGNFKLDQNFNLVNDDGGIVQGYGVDANYKIVDNALTNMRIPLGNQTLAVATSTVLFGGNLNAGGNVTTQASLLTSNTLYSDAAATIPATATTPLTSIYNSTGSQLFNTGDVITTTNISRGGSTMPNHTFEINAANTTKSTANGTTLGDYTTFLQNSMGIDTTDGGSVAVTGGQITITGNHGTVNDLSIGPGTMIVNALGATPTEPFTFTKSQSADGESISTQFISYDSLGQSQTIELTAVMQSKSSLGTVWRFSSSSEANSTASKLLGNGLLTFDPAGQLKTVTGNNISLNHTGTGAVTPQPITLNFAPSGGTFTALADSTSRLAALSQDGASLGTLQNFSLDSNGTIIGTFSNSLQRDLGQVALATFVNPQGLLEAGNNLFSVTSNSGLASIVKPDTGGAGKIVGSALESSNVDLSREFINLINASTGYNANSRVLNTSDRLIQELLQNIQ